MISYKLDNVELSTYGVRVKNTEGLHDLPKMKTPLTSDFPDRHGERVDLTSVFYEAREIELECWIEASSRADFLTKLNTFITTALVKTGLRQLVVEYDTTKPLCFLCYFADGLNVTRETKWNAQRMFGTFTLKLREPEPFKKVLKFTATAESLTCNLAFTTPKSVTVFWGDGTSQAVNATSANLSKTYTAGTYIIAIVGNANEITNVVTNATTIWSLQ